MLYCEKRRSDVKKSMPEASFADIIKKMAKEWNELGSDAKAEFTQLAEDDKGRYSRELDEYKAEIYKTNVTTVSS
jgi:hypothetical protein